MDKPRNSDDNDAHALRWGVFYRMSKKSRPVLMSTWDTRRLAKLYAKNVAWGHIRKVAVLWDMD